MKFLILGIYFSTSKKNNFFKLIITLTKDGDLLECIETVSIPDGNYSESLEEYLNTEYFFETSWDIPTQYIQFSINPASLKTCLCVVEDAPEDFSFDIVFSDDNTDNIMNTWIFLV